MFEHDRRRIIGRAVHDEDLSGHPGTLEAFLTPLHEFAYGDFLVHRRDNDAHFHIVKRRVARQDVLDNSGVVLGGSL